MNYLAQGINQGWQTGTQAIDAKKRRQQEEALEKARRDTGAALDTHHRNRALVTEVENDLAEIHHHRLSAMDLAEIEEDILDPLDAL